MEPDAPVGDRVVVVTTAAGTSDLVPSPANRFRVTDRVDSLYSPFVSAPLGVQVGGIVGTGPLGYSGWSPALGLAVGPLADALVPANAQRGSELELSVTGSGLGAVTAARFDPATGIHLEGIEADSSGNTLRLVLRIDPDAPETWRRLRLYAGTAEIPFADPGRSRFLVTGPVPEITAVSPNTLAIGAGPNTITLTGRNLDRATAVVATPVDGLAIARPVALDGSRLTLAIEAAPDAVAGSRVLTVTTPAGTSSPIPSPANRLILYREALAAPDSLAAPTVGVTVGAAVGGSTPVEHLTASRVGVRVGGGPGEGEATTVDALVAPPVGVAVGSFATGVETPTLLPGETYLLKVRGQGLDLLDGAAVVPGLDLAISLPVSEPGGDSAILSLSLPTDVQPGPRALKLVAGETPVHFVDPARALFWVAAGPPGIESLSPIVLRRGEGAELVIRGRHLQHARRVFAEPAAGLQISSTLTADADGGALRVNVHAREDAPLGPRTLRIETPGGRTTDQASPANTLTLY